MLYCIRSQFNKIILISFLNSFDYRFLIKKTKQLPYNFIGNLAKIQMSPVNARYQSYGEISFDLI